jgi:hypothetical protein
MARSGLLSVTLAISLGLAAVPADAPDIDRLIVQLGSTKFSEREAAARALDAIGAPALDALKEAAKSDDAEMRHRAEELLGKIERRLETDRILAPTKVHLVCKDLRIDDVLKELQKQTGEEVVLRGGDGRAPPTRTIAFDSGATTYWQAFDHLCVAAGLAEVQETVVVSSGEKAKRIVQIAQSKVTPLPTHYAGALRIRALPEKVASNAEEVGFTLGVGVESKLAALQLRGVCIDKAVDEQDRSLAQVTGNQTAEEAHRAVYLENTAIGARGVIQTGDHRIPVRLQRSGIGPSRLKELSGVLTAQARTAPEALLTVDDILKATPRPIDAKDGARLNVLEVEKEANGDVKIRVEIHPPPESNGDAVIPRRGRFRVRVMVGGVGPAILDFIGESQSLKLVDAKGESFPPPSMPNHIMRITNNVVSHELTLLYQPKDGQAEPAKLVYHGSRSVMIEVPFTLKDVPLPQ